MITVKLEQVIQALSAIDPFGPSRSKRPFGSKANSTAEMYERNVPRQFTHAKDTPRDAGASGFAVGGWQ